VVVLQTKQNLRRIVAGIDPSLGGAAVAVSPVGAKASGVVINLFAAGPPCKTIRGRIARWVAHSHNICDQLYKKPKPDLVVIEGYSFGSRGQAILDLAEFGGILRREMIALGFNVIEISPSELKKFITGKGNANKTEMVATMARQYGVSYKTNDEYDALGLNMMGQCYLDRTLCKNAVQKTLISKLKSE
jgi:crossover junction endodeoxyribonuclease RuvC